MRCTSDRCRNCASDTVCTIIEAATVVGLLALAIWGPALLEVLR